MSALFITGADKNDAKTLITAGIALTMQSLGYSTGVYKPICTGVNGAPQEIALINRLDARINTYTTCEFEENREPFMAAFAQNRPIEPLALLGDYKKIIPQNEITLIEGTNGPKTSIAQNFTEETLIKWFQVPVLFVVSAANASNAADVINSSGVNARGIIITDYATEHKFLPQTLEKAVRAPILGIFEQLPYEIMAEDLITEIITKVRLETALGMKISKL